LFADTAPTPEAASTRAATAVRRDEVLNMARDALYNSGEDVVVRIGMECKAYSAPIAQQAPSLYKTFASSYE
jgi:hypothetical protein